MTTNIAMLEGLTRAFRAIHPSLDPAPADWQAGANSTAWASMAAEIQRCVQSSATPRDKAAVYGQVVNLLDQAVQSLNGSRAYATGSAERLAAGGFLQQLLNKYRPLANV